MSIVQPERKRRNNVVTAFIEYQGKLLLLRRSKKVKTMKGKWAGISGYIEMTTDPLRQALKEIEEETGLSNEKVRVICVGQPLEVADTCNQDITWVVHPYFFRTNTDIVKLDWEHDKYLWINPQEIKDYDTVPKLKETLDRVFPIG
jgi:8-oxo-dGTP diphosphatase